MSEQLQEYVDSRAATLRVDPARGVIRGVKILGLESRNGRRYLPQALAAARGLYEGAKVNVNHLPDRASWGRDYRDRIGVMREVAYREGEGLFGDLHFNPKHPLAEQLAWDATHAPQNVGFSHNVRARLRAAGSEAVVEEILAVESVDLVADPATTSGLFESVAAGDDGLLLSLATVEDLVLRRPDLVEQLRQAFASDPNAIEDPQAWLQQHAALKADIEQLRVEERQLRRRQRIRQLLKEHGLPPLETGDVSEQSTGSDRWWSELVEARDDEQLRQLVAQRAEFVQQIRRWAGISGGPCSIEQRRVQEELQPTTTAEEFARAIS